MTAPTVDPTTGEIHADTIEEARQALGRALATLAAETGALTDPDDVPDLARALCVLRDFRQDAATVAADCEQLMVGLMGERRVEVSGLGVFEARRRMKRTGWAEHMDDLVADVIATAETCGDDGEGVRDLSPLEVARELRAAITFGAGKVTRLRELGLEPDMYCRETPDGWSVQLPPRDHGQDIA